MSAMDDGYDLIGLLGGLVKGSRDWEEVPGPQPSQGTDYWFCGVGAEGGPLEALVHLDEEHLRLVVSEPPEDRIILDLRQEAEPDLEALAEENGIDLNPQRQMRR
jgi:hypothetical protein